MSDCYVQGSAPRTVEWVILTVTKTTKTTRARRDNNVTITGEFLEKVRVAIHHIAASIRQAMGIGNDLFQNEMILVDVY